jgi:Zn-dependent protease
MSYLIVVPVILMSIIIHEISHGWAAYLLGDDTAKRYGRLSINPVKHIDLFGTIILPMLLLITTRGALVFGYAKPVPINPYNFSVVKRDTGISAAAGPLSNIIIAVFFSILFRVISLFPIPYPSPIGSFVIFVMQTLMLIIFFNLILAFFNLIPMPPLDGSKILGAFLPDKYYFPFMRFERQGMMVFMGVILFSYLFGLNIIGGVLLPPINMMMKLLIGVGIF